MKKVSYILLSLAVFLSLLSTSAFAANVKEREEDVWDGLSMMEPTETTIIDGKTYYCITKCAELAYIAANDQYSNTYKNISLTTDLVFNATLPEYGEDGTCTNTEELHAFTPIERFKGVFLGNGHTISGLYVNSTEYETAFIRELQGGSISDLHFKDSCIIGGTYAAGICGSVSVYANPVDYSADPVVYFGQKSAIQNCSFSGAIFGETGCGGIVGKIWVNGEEDYTNPESFPSVSIENSVFSGSVNGNGFYTGGIIGTIDGKWGTVTVCNCENLGNVNGQADVGGINGFLNNVADLTVRIENCINRGNVVATRQGAGISGGWCNVGNTTCSGCINIGDVRCSGSDAAGLVAYISTENGYGNNDYYKDKNVAPGHYLIQSCFSMGSISGDTPGGLIGFIGLQDEGTVILRDSFFCGKLTSERYYTSAFINRIGIFGAGSVSTENCYAVGLASGSQTGALLGNIYRHETEEEATVSFSGCKWLNSMANGLCATQTEVAFQTSGCEALSVAEMKQRDSYPEFDFNAVWKMGDPSGYPFPVLSAIQAEPDLVPLYQAAGGNVSISDLSQTVVRADVNLLLDAQVVVAVYNEDGQMVSIASRDFSAGAYPEQDFPLERSLSVGDQIRIFTLEKPTFAPIGIPVVKIVDEELPEKLFTAYLELDEEQRLFARINSPIVPSADNYVSIKYEFDNGNYSADNDVYSGTGNIGCELTGQFSYACPCRITSIELTHYVNDQVVATAHTPVSIEVKEGIGTPINITGIQTRYSDRKGETCIRYEFAIDQPLDTSKSYMINYQNETMYSHNHKLKTAHVENGKLVCYQRASDSFPGTGHFWVTYADTITMAPDGTVTITYLPKGIGYRFNNDTLTAE